ncbi:MAG: hypothetical protein ABSC71_04195, partial [Candidatus Acidiferrales bacterium]
DRCERRQREDSQEPAKNHGGANVQIRPPRAIETEMGIGTARHFAATRTSLKHKYRHDITTGERVRARRWKRLLKKFWNPPICYALNFVYARIFLYL